MSMVGNEAALEAVAIGWLGDLGWKHAHGPDLLPDGDTPERAGFEDVILAGRLEAAVRRLNPELPIDAIDEVLGRLLRTVEPALLEENYRLHELVANGVPVEYRTKTGDLRTGHAAIVDFENPTENDLLVVSQFTVKENGHTRRPDLVVFVNGLPLAVFELKDPGNQQATLKGAWNQLQTYLREIPALFRTNAVNVVSDGLQARIGATTAGWEHYAPWKTIDGEEHADPALPQLQVLINGVFEPGRFLDLVRNFVVFSDERHGDQALLVKRVAKYHQYWAVCAAVDSTINASTEGDGRAGVVWHTQGSGKSLEMLFYAAKVMREPAMANPTLVLLADRNDIDDQLFDEVFAAARNLPERPVQATSRENLQELLRRASGGIVFTTVQKFFPKVEKGQSAKGVRYPTLTDRRNVVVIADEAHRSQYDFIDGFARHLRDALPNASYIGFTGTPIESADKSTRRVFGDYVSIYDLTQAVDDGATVRIYYEARLAKIELSEDETEKLDESFEEVTEGEETESKERLKTRWARLEALVGAPKRIELVAKDIVEHWEARRSVLSGKAMIVCMSRRICVALYDEIAKLRPDWVTTDDATGKVKVVITGSASDEPSIQAHVRSKEKLRDVKARAKDPGDELELVIVRDMWLTGFDSPSMHTMYADKPMRGAALMQAIARINRTFRDKPGALVVDYIGLADSLRKALADYTDRSRKEAGIPVEQVVELVVEKHEVVTKILHGHDWDGARSGDAAQYVTALAATVNFVVGDQDRRQRFLDQTLALVQAFALAVPHPKALAVRDDVGFFQDVRNQIRKLDGLGGDGQRSGEDVDTAISQILSKAVAANGVVDIYEAAGLEKPDIALLSEEFLEDVKRLPYKNLQLELLKKLLADEIRTVGQRNLVTGRKFSELLTKSILNYQNRSLTSAEVIAELVELAKQLQAERDRGTKLKLNEAELAFYDAISTNDSAVLEMGDDILRQIALEVVDTVRRNAAIDWAVKEQVRSKLRGAVKRVLMNHDYPPDKAEAATTLVLEQAELFADELVVT